MTQTDTLNALVNISASTKPTFPTQDHWTRVTQAYFEDYAATLHQLTPDGTPPITLPAESALLAHLKPVETRSLTRVSESGIFTGVTKAQLAGGARRALEAGTVRLRAGYADLYRSVQARSSSHRDKISILSVNWSRHFIASCLTAADLALPAEVILSNELEGLNEDAPSTGRIVPAAEWDVVSSGDKLHYLKALRHQDSETGQARTVVYVGDSWTDLECLIAADWGICIRDKEIGGTQRKLAEALERLGVKCVHVDEWEGADASRVVWARDFGEILRWAKGRE